jgi:Domain of unknown function (DUF374)
MTMRPFKRIVTSSAFQEAVGAAAASYLRFTWRTSRVVLEPTGIYETVETPAIIAMWHGQHFMAPFIKRNDPRHRTKVLISRHRDGEINARAAERLDIGTIRGSGAHNAEFHRKGGAVGCSKGCAHRWPWRSETCAVFRTANLPSGDGLEPTHRARQLGSLGHQLAVQPDGTCGERSDLCAARF